MTKPKILIIEVLFLFTNAYFTFTSAQNLGAYSDYRDRFFIFDSGRNVKAEDFLVQSFKIGGTCILYVNNQGHLKIYNDGQIVKLESGGISAYHATDYLAAYNVYEKLIVLEGLNPVVLSYRCPYYDVQDSLIVFYDKNIESLRVYYNGTIEDIESGMLGDPAFRLRSGDNIVAYTSMLNDNFKVYYKGQSHTLLNNVKGLRYRAGKDIVAYVNPIDNSFNVFYKGEVHQLEVFAPKNYQTGDGFVAYVDNSGMFKVFYKGGVTELSSFTPDGYVAEDNILLFTEDRFLKIFTHGQIYDVEGYVPKNFKIDWNSVIYPDNTNRLWLFKDGDKKMLGNEFVETYDIYRDLVIIGAKFNRTLIYYNTSFYTGVSY